MDSKEEKVYVIMEYPFDDDGGGVPIGYCETLEDAQQLCKELDGKQKDDIEMWNSHCFDCECNCDAFKSKDCKKALEALERIRKSKKDCPYVGGIELREIFYGKENKSGGFEICCDHQTTMYGENCYIVNECRKLNKNEEKR